MEAERMFDRLRAGGEIVRAVASGVPERDSARRPPGGGWSVREVLGHLLSEEVEDFRRRLDLLLRAPGAEWPALDPAGRVREGGFQEREARGLLDAFLEERRRSLDWLRGLPSTDWTAAKSHPVAGTLRAGDLLASWADHDLLHARQILRILHAILGEECAPFSTEYAGTW